MSRRRAKKKPTKKFDRCWGCGTFTPFVCARCLKPVCVILGSLTPHAGGCSKLRAAPGQPGVYHLVCTPRCRLRRSPTVLAVIAKGGTAPRQPSPSPAFEEDFEYSDVRRVPVWQDLDEAGVALPPQLKALARGEKP